MFGTNLVPNLHATSNPPFPVVFKCCGRGLPLEYQGIDKDLVDLIRRFDFTRDRQFHIDLFSTLNEYPRMSHCPPTMFSVNSPSGSITLVPRRSARCLPPAMASAWVYSLILCSPPSHSLKSIAARTSGTRFVE